MHTALRSSTPSTLAAVVATTATVSAGAAFVFSTAPATTDADAAEATAPPSYKIEADLMDKIASKSYIRQRNPHPDRRPRGVPKTVRVLAIDLPEMRAAFDGECRVNLKRIFPDGIAPSKVMYQQDKNAKVEILQKSLAQSVVRCRNAKSKRVGVELLEASVAELNPHNLRKTHKFGNYLYDPGKFARHQTEHEEHSPALSDHEDDEPDNRSRKPVVNENKTRKGNEPLDMVLATEEDELDAPWNQYAWIEELQTRVAGNVRFGAPLERSSKITQVIYGNVYRQQVPSSRRLIEWFLPRFFQRDPCGVDGEGLNWASHKPHAVIANGSAMQRVPGSMKLLADCCKEANVPLYIVFDQRAWGENTHSDLSSALRDMRQTIKGRIVASVLEEQGGAFSRGRIVGQLETDAWWQAKELQRKAQQAIRDANDEYLRGRENDWSKLDAEGLKERLAEHGVLVISHVEGQDNSVAQSKSSWLGWFGRKKAAKGGFSTTAGMLQLAKECIRNTEEGETVDTVEENEARSGSHTQQTASDDEEVAGVTA